MSEIECAPGYQRAEGRWRDDDGSHPSGRAEWCTKHFGKDASHSSEAYWDFYVTGDLRSVGVYRDGKREGLWRFFDASGDLEMVGTFHQGEMNGHWLVWPDGELGDTISISYGEGKVNGSIATWDEHGVLRSDMPYVDGVLSGSYRTWSADGAPVAEQTWRAGKLEGPQRRFYPDGRPSFEGIASSGLLVGAATRFYPTGEQLVIEEYRDGAPAGSWRYTTPMGELGKIEEYTDGRLVEVRFGVPQVSTKSVCPEQAVLKKTILDEETRRSQITCAVSQGNHLELVWTTEWDWDSSLIEVKKSPELDASD